jgi:hypothetical protein
MSVTRAGIAAVLALACGAAGFAPVRLAAQPAMEQAAPATEWSAQDQRRPRIRVQPQPPAWPYPLPGDYAWPGPGAVRVCQDWYATEYRPSGTVVTPQMRCRWVRG